MSRYSGRDYVNKMCDEQEQSAASLGNWAIVDFWRDVREKLMDNVCVPYERDIAKLEFEDVVDPYEHETVCEDLDRTERVLAEVREGWAATEEECGRLTEQLRDAEATIVELNAELDAYRHMEAIHLG